MRCGVEQEEQASWCAVCITLPLNTGIGKSCSGKLAGLTVLLCGWCLCLKLGTRHQN